MTLALREDLEVVNQILEIGGTQTRPARHLFVERVACGINASDDGRLDRFPVEGWMAAVHELVLMPLGIREGGVRDVGRRSEEHTSELQSRSDLVCRLLLEKKKNRTPRRG